MAARLLCANPQCSYDAEHGKVRGKSKRPMGYCCWACRMEVMPEHADFSIYAPGSCHGWKCWHRTSPDSWIRARAAHDANEPAKTFGNFIKYLCGVLLFWKTPRYDVRDDDTSEGESNDSDDLV